MKSHPLYTRVKACKTNKKMYPRLQISYLNLIAGAKDKIYENFFIILKSSKNKWLETQKYTIDSYKIIL